MQTKVNTHIPNQILTAIQTNAYSTPRPPSSKSHNIYSPTSLQLPPPRTLAASPGMPPKKRKSKARPTKLKPNRDRFINPAWRNGVSNAPQWLTGKKATKARDEEEARVPLDEEAADAAHALRHLSRSPSPDYGDNINQGDEHHQQVHISTRAASIVERGNGSVLGAALGKTFANRALAAPVVELHEG